jgi:hypothetical protein
MPPVRALVVAMLVVGCTPRWNPKARLGTDGTPRGARELELSCDDGGRCIGRRRGVVTARGGDSIDWIVVRVPAVCSSRRLDVELQWQPPRDRSRLLLSVHDAKLRRQARGHRDDSDDEDDDDDERRWHKLSATAEYVAGGRYFIKVSAARADDAGAYRLRVVEDIGRSGWPSCNRRDIYLPRPEDAVVPRSPVAGTPVAILEAGMSRTGATSAWLDEPSFVIDAGDPSIGVASRGVLLDPRGRVVRGGEFVIDEVWQRGEARFASLRLVEPGRFRRRMELGWDLWTGVILR